MVTAQHHLPFQVEPLSPSFGAEVSGLDLATPLDASAAETLQTLLREQSVLRFRNQRLTAADQVRVLSYFGPISTFEGGHEFRLVSNAQPGAAAPTGRLPFHSDHMSAKEPVQITSLYGVEVDSDAAPTAFASANHAYDSLPEELRQRIQGLSALNIYGGVGRRIGVSDPPVYRASRPDSPSAVHPVAYTRPADGRRLLFVSEMSTDSVVGLSPTESEQLLQLLFSYIYHHENIFEVSWSPGDLVIWDNYAAQHGRAYVGSEQGERTLRKVNVGGEPVLRSRQD
jgi:alpha-ketoglutarate-dependent taurine dioxygenase